MSEKDPTSEKSIQGAKHLHDHELNISYAVYHLSCAHFLIVQQRKVIGKDELPLKWKHYKTYLPVAPVIPNPLAMLM